MPRSMIYDGHTYFVNDYGIPEPLDLDETIEEAIDDSMDLRLPGVEESDDYSPAEEQDED